jgi:pimeloyl-ACP methyl ester carboxylesterase
MRETPIRFVATTVPGFGGTAPPGDLSMESYSKLAGKLASDLGCDAIVGHSLGANIAIEMASAGAFSGPLVLLSPSFSRRDESRFPRTLDRLSRVLGQLPYSLTLKIIGPAMKSSLPPTRREALIAELKKNDPPAPRRDRQARPRGVNEHGAPLKGWRARSRRTTPRRARAPTACRNGRQSTCAT